MPILSLAAIAPALEMIKRAGLGAIRTKSEALTSFFLELAEDRLSRLGFTVATPRPTQRRGSHISLAHPAGWQIVQAMIDSARIIPDFREPDNIRFGMAPLYTSFTELATAIGRIEEIVASDIHRSYASRRGPVT
jgi:kynureninase